MSTFIGLDLAWKASNESGICWLEGESADLACSRLEADARSTEDLADEIAAVPGTVIVAIDAPLLYTPSRWVEKEISRQFARHKASAHSAHAAVRQERTAGIDLGIALESRGFTLDPSALRQHGNDCRAAIEVYPHTIHVRLFNLEERLPYKKRAGRTVAFRRSVLQRYQCHLQELIELEAPGVLEGAAVSHALTPQAAASAKGTALKRLEDKLDGLTCAMAAWLAWSNHETWETIGDLHGYMVVPRAGNARRLRS